MNTTQKNSNIPDQPDQSVAVEKVPEAAQLLLNELRGWAAEVADYGWPHFDEFALRMESLIPTLMEPLVATENVQLAPELTQDCARFETALDQFTRQLRGVDTCFTSWQSACREFERLCGEYAHLCAATSGNKTLGKPYRKDSV